MWKKQKKGVSDVEEEEEEETLDLISQLPEALVVQILSLLPTKDAVTSCILSKRWRYLWNSIHNFHFIDRNYNNVKNFVSFVDHVLTHSTCSKINKFQLDILYRDWEFELKVSEWLSFAVDNKVEHVVLDALLLADQLYYELPLSMYTCSSLITLHLSCWVFDKGMAIAWNSLKTLKLHSTELEDDDIVMLLSGCPALETMELSFWEGCRRLEITSSNLKRLTLTNYVLPLVGEYDSLEIFAPHLQHLDISGRGLIYRLVNVSSLVTARLTFRIGFIDENLVLGYLQKLSYVTELIIGSWFAEAVFMWQYEGVMLPELRCKCLTLQLHVSKYNLYGIASLLQASPLLESLNINIRSECCYSPCQLEQSYFDEVDNINLPSWIPNAVFPNINNVTIVVWGGCLKKLSEEGLCKLFELSNFLLKNAVALQKLIIVAKKKKCFTCSENCESQHLSQLAKKLYDTPRSSTNFVIIYQELA